MVLGLLEDASYRQDADRDIESLAITEPVAEATEYEDLGAHEVRYSRAMWDDDYGTAMTAARYIADHATAAELAGYRAWWWFLASATLRTTLASKELRKMRCVEVPALA